MTADHEVDLTDRVYLVAGGAGVAGGCVAAALLRCGGTVVVPSRSAERLAALRAATATACRDRLVTVAVDICAPAALEQLRDTVLDAHGRLDGVVASLGGWWQGAPLTKIPLELWERVLRDNLTTHFLVARAFLPVLAERRDGVYVAMAGIAARQPEPNSGPISVTGAAQSMMMATLRAELAGTPVRLHEVTVLTPIVTAGWQADLPVKAGWLNGEQVGDYVARVVAPTFEPADWLVLSIP